MSQCEDYPCCGHTDGLGCNWVSPNEIQPCDVCIEARVSYPYHRMWPGDCPTANRNREDKAMADAKADSRILGEHTHRCFGHDDAAAVYVWRKYFLCEECFEEELRDELAESRQDMYERMSYGSDDMY